MAQSIILKRSALPGKVPNTGSLNAGEIAVNTYDGKLFIKRSGNVDSIEGIVVTNSTTTGSITLTRTGSFGELVVTQDANITRDLYVTNDIIGAGDIDITGDITGSSALLSGSLILSGSQTITNNLTVLGTVNARQFNISVISSSVLFQSGSTKFGDTSDDTHSFTGSVSVSGSFLLNGQAVGGGTTSGSFTGSFTGDGSGLRGVVSDDLPIDGWDYNSNSSASISEFNNESRKYLIDFQWEEEVGTPIGFKTFISNVTGSSQIVPTEAGIKFIVGNQQVALVGPNGIESVPPAGTISGSSQLTASVLATTGSNVFRGIQILSGSIIPAIDNTYDLGSIAYQWRDVYVSSGSLYIDGTKVLGSTGNELQITTDEGQSIKILESGTDSIILQSADGDIQLKASGGGNLLFDPTTGLIDVRGTLQIQDGNKITSSGGNAIVFGNNIVVSGSLTSTGNINGINLTTFSSSIASTFSNQNTATSSYETKFSTLATYTGSVENRFTTLATLTGSNSIRLTNLETTSGSVNTRLTEIGVVTGSLISSASAAKTTNDSQGVSITNLNTLTASALTRLTALEVETSNLETFSGSQLSKDATLATLTASYDGRFTTLGSLSGSFARTNSTNIFSGDQTITGSLYVSANLVVQGSSSIQNISSSTLNIGTNIITVAVNQPSVRFGGISVIDSGSSGGSGSFLYDSVQDEFIFVHRGNGTNVTSSHFVLGPETYDNLGNETYLTNNKIPKGTGKEHLNDSQISDDGTTVSIGGALTVTGNITGPIRATNGIVSGSSQITYASISSIPSGIVSGSSQITYASISSIPSGIVSGSSQVIGILSSLNTYTGSNDTTNTAQNTRLTTIESVTGSYETKGRSIVSGSSQITLSSTTGYGSVLNQAVLTTSSPTFAGATLTGTITSNVTNNYGLVLNRAAVTNYNGISLQTAGVAQWYVGMRENLSSNNYIIYNESGTDALTISKSNSNATFAGTITENSSLRYKENVETIKYGLDKVIQMRGVTYNKKDNGVKEVGVIAEEIYEVLPEVVLKNEEGEIDSVSYSRITAVLIEAIKDLKKEIEDLKANR